MIKIMDHPSCLQACKQIFVLSLVIHFILILIHSVLSLQEITHRLTQETIANYEANQGKMVILAMCSYDFFHNSMGAIGAIGNRYGYLLLFATFSLAKEFAYAILGALGIWVGYPYVLTDLWFVLTGFYLATSIERIHYYASNNPSYYYDTTEHQHRRVTAPAIHGIHRGASEESESASSDTQPPPPAVVAGRIPSLSLHQQAFSVIPQPMPSTIPPIVTPPRRHKSTDSFSSRAAAAAYTGANKTGSRTYHSYYYY